MVIPFLLVGCRTQDANEPEPVVDLEADENPAEGDKIVEHEEVEDVQIKLQFAGDVFIHAGPMEAARTGSNAFDFKPFLTHIRPFINGDLAIANMEVPVDAVGGNQNLGGFPNFNNPFEILEALKYAGFNHLISANNHSFDMGMDGLINTVANFERAGIAHTGMNRNQAEFDEHTIVDVGGINIGIIAYTDSVNGLEFMVPAASLPYAVRRFASHTLESIPQMAQDMAAIRAAGADLVVLALHWGQEYGDEPTYMQRQVARALSEAGADVIMGKHSHTVHPMEWIEQDNGHRTLVMYSLGNFVADQTRLFNPANVDRLISHDSNNLMNMPFMGRTQFGMLVSLYVTKDANGIVSLGEATALPTLCMRDFNGTTLGAVDNVAVLPLVNGQVPEFVADLDVIRWGEVAYEHIVNIVGREFIPASD